MAYEPNTTFRKEFSVSGQPIPAASSWELVVPLEKNDLKYGLVMLHVPNSATGNKRLGGIICCTRISGEAFSEITGDEVYSVYGYLFHDWRMQGWNQGLDGKLSDGAFGSASRIQISSCYIDGNDLKIMFYNTLPSSAQTLSIVGVAQFWK